jgi:hypothetical protein
VLINPQEQETREIIGAREAREEREPIMYSIEPAPDFITIL